MNRLLSHASYYDRKGELYFGGISGIISIPSSQQLESIPEQVTTYITDIKIKGKSIWDNDRKENPLRQSVRMIPMTKAWKLIFLLLITIICSRCVMLIDWEASIMTGYIWRKVETRPSTPI